MKYSLKKRVLIIFLIVIAACAACLLVMVRQTMRKLINANVENVYQNMAVSVLNSYEGVIDNLELLSQQLGFGVVTADLLQRSVSPDTPPFERVELQQQIKENVRILAFGNSDAGLVVYDNGREVLYSNYPVAEVNELFEPEHQLYQSKEISCFGPKKSLAAFLGEEVLMIRRMISREQEEPVYLSIETSFNALDRALPPDNPLVLINPQGVVAFCSDLSLMPAGERWSEKAGGKGISGDYQIFEIKSERGFTLALMADMKEIRSAQFQSYLALLAILVVFGLLLVVLAYVLWRTVYRPLRLFDERLDDLLLDQPRQEKRFYTGMEEYDRLLDRMEGMHASIRVMIEQLITQEKEKNQMQLEKLRYQINPHFLLNTLNSVHWMAMMNNQEEIDRMIQALNHLLAYNLDRDGENTDIERELAAIGEYMLLQQIRYDFSYCVIREPEGTRFPYVTPKFILQPIIENSLSHGYRENMHIKLTVMDAGETVGIIIEDDGRGISAEQVDLFKQQIAEINRDMAHYEKRQFGIGLEYVLLSIADFYRRRGKSAEFLIRRRPGGGTVVSLNIPKIIGPKGKEAECLKY